MSRTQAKDKQLMHRFGRLVRHYRLKYKLSYQDLANLANSTKFQLHQIEHGKAEPTLSLYFRIALALEQKPEEWLEEMRKRRIA